MSGTISNVEAREILDSRATPTLECRVTLDDGTVGIASVPSGASVGKYEAHELRDGDADWYGGKGVLKARDNITGEIRERITGMKCDSQTAIDSALIALDGTKNKSRLGANATLAVSVAVARAAAKHHSLELFEYLGGKRARGMPTPMMNILNGGLHASNNLDIQEFMIVPISAKNATRGVAICVDIYKKLREILLCEHLCVSVGDEGGFAPDLASDEDALRLICRAIGECGYSDSDVKIAIDAAASGWHSEGEYLLPKSKKKYTSEELGDYYVYLSEKYPLVSIEDGLGEEDYDGWHNLTERLGGRIRLVGDDLFVTNAERLRMGMDIGIANSILVKPNQIGTVSETLDVIALAQKGGYPHIISHRSGETSDSFIADLAVATSAPFIKAGAPARGECVAKYNRLTEIDGMLWKNE